MDLLGNSVISFLSHSKGQILNQGLETTVQAGRLFL